MCSLAKAHMLANASDELEASGALLKALEARRVATEGFRAAALDTNDATARSTLHLLVAQQEQAITDLQRKVELGKGKADSGGRHPAATHKLPQRGRLAESAYSASPPGRQRVPITAQSVISAAAPASFLLESRTNRRSNSPSESVMQSPASSIFPEGSYMVLKQPAPLDPFIHFERWLEGMLETLSKPVAFAMAPLPDRDALAKAPRAPNAGVTPVTGMPAPRDTIGESFLIVPAAAGSSSKPLSDTSPKGAVTHESQIPISASKKTAEELTLENNSLKINLDYLARQYHQLVEERATEREKLKDSIATFGDRVRAEQAERAKRSTDSSQDVRVQELERQLNATKEELAAANAAVAKYKGRYEQVRDAIKRKRATREQELAAGQAPSSNGSTTNHSGPVRTES